MTAATNFSWCSPDLSQEIARHAQTMTLQRGQTIYTPGDKASGAIVVEKGLVRLYRVVKSGDKHLLYLLNGQCMCALSTLANLIDREIDLYAVAEEDCVVHVIPRETSELLFMTNKEWRDFTLNSIMDGWQASLNTLDQVVFEPLQRRLEIYLSEHAALSQRKIVRKSHAEIAGDLNVSREAVSRVLKAMERRDELHLGHGSIKVIKLRA